MKVDVKEPEKAAPPIQHSTAIGNFCKANLRGNFNGFIFFICSKYSGVSGKL